MKGVSVAMTTCNGEPFLNEQLESLFRQTEPAAEIVVCDDASTDGTLDILERHAAAGRLRLIKNRERLGVVANFKQAVSHCTPGNDIAFCDQDDIWKQDKISKGSRLLRAAEVKRPGPAISFSDLSLTDSAGVVTDESFWSVLNVDPEKESFQSLLFGNFITGCTLMMNDEMRALFDEMPAQAVTMHDAWTGLLAFSLGSYQYTREPLVYYRQHTANVTGSTNQRVTLQQKLNQNIRQIRTNKKYLHAEIAMALCFLKQYGKDLTKTDAQTLYYFARLSDATWMSKKFLSLKARSYRYNGFFKLR